MLPRSVYRSYTSMNFETQLKRFIKLISGNRKIRRLLKDDICCTIVDKYLLASILTYFIRARLSCQEYTTHNFFIALYLCHEIQEEVDYYKHKIIEIYFGEITINNVSECYRLFDRERMKLFKEMDFNGNVSLEDCEHIFKHTNHPGFSRSRRYSHQGVIRDENKVCDFCECPIM